MSSKKEWDVYTTITLSVLVTVTAGSAEEAKEIVREKHDNRELEYEVGEAYSLSDPEDMHIDDVQEAE